MTNDAIKRERERIARELHDRLGQALTALKLDMAWIKRRLNEGQAASTAISQRLSEMMSHIDISVDEVRSIAYALRTPAIGPQDLRELIESYVRSTATRGGLSVYCDIGHDLPLSGEQCQQTLHIVQEALTNILRHAAARTIWICLARAADGIELRIRDDGLGIRSASATGLRGTLGLAGMAERAHAVGARLTIEVPPQGGTLLRLVIPHSGSGAVPSDYSTPHKGN